MLNGDLGIASALPCPPQESVDPLRPALYSATDRAARLEKIALLPLRRGRRRIISALQISVDCALIVAAFVLSGLIRQGFDHGQQTTVIVATIIPIYLGVALNNDALNSGTILDTFRSISRGCSAFLFAACSMLLVAFFLKAGADFSRLMFAAGSGLALMLLIAGRLAMTRFTRAFLGMYPYADLCIYDGVARGPKSSPGAIDAASIGLRPDVRDPNAIALLGRIATGLDKIIVHCRPEDREKWSFLLKSLDVSAEIVMPELAGIAPLSINYRAGNPSIQLSNGRLAWNQQLIKRGFDLVVTIAALPLLVPIFAFIAVAIKLDSRGPIFFRQPRIGLGNRSFQIFKFRSMHVARSDLDGTQSTGRDDDRITRVGRFIRATSLDELPQFLNALKGDMSIVGPRPHAIGSTADAQLFWMIDHHYWHRHTIKPGLTGLAQVRGFRGATERRQDFENRLQSDLEYRANWSLWTDIKIVLLTFRVLVHKNAF